MLIWSNYIKKIPIFGNIYKNNYFVWKRFYINFLRNSGLRPGPVIVSWVATNRCNSKCVYCEARANEENPEELTTAQIKGVLDELRDLKVKRFFVIGGEPFMRKDLFEVFDYAKKRDMIIGVFTNSLLYRKLKEKIKNIGFQNIWTSIDGLAETHNKYRGHPGAYEITMEAIRYYSKIEIPVRVVNTVVHPNNFDELPELFEHLKKAGTNWWRLGAVMPVGRARNEQFSLSPEKTIKLFQYVEQFRKHLKVTISEEMGYLGCWEEKVKDAPFFCHAGLSFCAIMPDGNIVPCQTDDGIKYSEGNVKVMPFKELWKNGFRSFRYAKLEDECDACHHKKACSGGCWIARANEAQCLINICEAAPYDQ